MSVIYGDDAKNHHAVNLNTGLTINKGELVSADEGSGYVVWKEPDGTTNQITLGEHTVKIIGGYHR